MKKLLLLGLLLMSMSSYAIDVDLLKQSLVGSWYPAIDLSYNNTPRAEYELNFYIDGDNLMVRYVADYSWVWGNENNKIVNKYGTCVVKINHDGTLGFELSRYETAYDRKGNEERIGYGEFSYKLYFVDGMLMGKETWGKQYLKMQTMNSRNLCRFKTIAQAERRGNVSSYPFEESSYTTQVNYCNADNSNIEKFYKDGVIDEFSNCNPDDYEYGFLIDDWYYFDDGNWNYGYQGFQIKIFARDGNYYVKYYSDLDKWEYDVAPIHICDKDGEISLSFSTTQKFHEKCMGYDWYWRYDMTFTIDDVGVNKMYGYREWTHVFGPLDACGIKEPERCNIMYINGR